MLELPEANVIAQQIEQVIGRRIVKKATVLKSPHKLTWFEGDPASYPAMLKGKGIEAAAALGGMIEIRLGELALTFSDGVNLRFHRDADAIPEKHQLLLELDDGYFLSAAVQMYGGICCFKPGEYENEYYLAARDKPSPLGADFSKEYVQRMFIEEKAEKLSAKAFLATEQRIPGLGNGVLQDILFLSHIHPKRKMKSVTKSELNVLYRTIKSTMKEMTQKGGRDTEKDLLGNFGDYKTKMSKKTVGHPCDDCSAVIEKAAYMGGTVYFCPQCQPL